MRDQFIKCHKNDFGRKDYRLQSDKSALSLHVSKIINSNIGQAIPALGKPYLAKHTSQMMLPSQDISATFDHSAARLPLNKNSSTQARRNSHNRSTNTNGETKAIRGREKYRSRRDPLEDRGGIDEQ